MKSIEITVTPAGQSTVVTRGFTGPSCVEASQFVERALGHVLHVERTEAFFQAPLPAPATPLYQEPS